MPLPLKKLLTEADVETPENRGLFKAVQGYAVVPHGRKHVWLGLLSFTPRDTDHQKEIATFLCACGQKATSAYDLFKSYQKDYDYKEALRENPEYGKTPEGQEVGKKLTEMKGQTVFAIGLASPAYTDIFPIGRPWSKEFDKGF